MNNSSSRKVKPIKIFVFIILVAFIFPGLISIRNHESATLTITTQSKLPFEFVVKEGDGVTSGSLQLNCHIIVKEGIGEFKSGSRDDMFYYGVPISPFTRFSRKIVVERVDKSGNIVERIESRLGQVIYVKVGKTPNSKGNETIYVEAPI